MKRVVILGLILVISLIGLVSAACTGSTPKDFCFGTKIHAYECNGTAYVDYIKGDCSITGLTCRNAECVEIGECETNSDCDDENACTIDSCVVDSTNRCENIIKEGCKFQGVCIPFGSRVSEENNNYCSFNGELIKQKTDEDVCQNDYECENNICLNGKCGDSTSYNAIKIGLTVIGILFIIQILILFRKSKK